MLAEIITIGDEILIGQVVDTNSAWMATELNKIGVKVKQISSVSDDASHIVNALNEAQERASLVLITGGLGPTKDDITKLTLAKYFGMELRRDLETQQHIENIFQRLNRPMIEANYKQADVPDGCIVIQNANGTAPCMWFEWKGKIIVSMPGVPFEMMYLMEEEILPRIKNAFQLPSIVHRTILTAGLGESFLAQEIEEIEEQLPAHIKLAYLPKLGQVRLRLTGQGADENQLNHEVKDFASQIIQKIEKYVIVEEDITLEQAVLNIMSNKGWRLSLAESCTGGYIAHLLTKIPGSSQVFLGGAVVYSNVLKEKILNVSPQTLQTYGAVSEDTVVEMAKGAILNFDSDYAIAVSGIAGPEGGTPDKPVGTVWIAVASREKVLSKRFNFGNKRLQNIERASTSAFTLLLAMLKEDGKTSA